MKTQITSLKNKMKIKHFSMSEAKDSGIVQIYMSFPDKHWNVEAQDGVDYDENGKATKTIDLFFSECGCCKDLDTDEYVIIDNISIKSDYLNKFEYMDVSVSKNKEEIYITCYEFPFEDEDITDLDIEVI